jgi:hypothetical protein
MFNTQTDYKFEKFVNGLFLVLTMGTLAVTTLLALSDTSPAAQVNIWQALLLDGSYYPVFTAIILWLPIVLLLMLVKTMIVFMFNILFAKDGKKIPYAYKVRW